MDGYEKTPTLGLNKPEKGDFDWDAPLNENWEILDRVGGAQLPLLATIDLDYKLSGDAAIGWALAGSTISGDIYTSLWDAMKAAYDRSTAANETYYGATFSVKTDAVTGWRFVTNDVATSANSLFGDFLGHVLNVDNKTITLRAGYQTYTNLTTSTLSKVGKILQQNIPNIKGEFYVSNVAQDTNGSSSGASRTNGAFKYTALGGTTGAAWNAAGGLFTFDASSYKSGKNGTSTYSSDEQVRPQTKFVYRYYKVGNTITNVENIDVGNILSALSSYVTSSDVDSRITSVMESGRVLNYSSGTAVTFPLSSSKFTAPSQGVYMVNAKWGGNNNGVRAYVNDVEIASGGNSQGGSAYVDQGSCAYIPLDKGDVLYFSEACRAVRLSKFYTYKN